MSAIAQATSEPTPEVLHTLSANDLMRLVQVALGKLASPTDWKVIVASHLALDAQYAAGLREGERRGFQQGYIAALQEAAVPAEEIMDRISRP